MKEYIQTKDNQIFIFALLTNLGVFLLVGLGVLNPTWLGGSITGGFTMLSYSTLIPLLGQAVVKARLAALSRH